MKYNYNLQKKGIYFILPTLVTYGIFLIYPMFSAFNYSLYKWNLISEKKFIGIGNFIRLYGDKRFWNSFYTTIHFTIISVIIIIVIAFLLALILEEILNLKIFPIFIIYPCRFNNGCNCNCMAVYVSVHRFTITHIFRYFWD